MRAHDENYVVACKLKAIGTGSLYQSWTRVGSGWVGTGRVKSDPRPTLAYTGAQVHRCTKSD
jgi:hypothetical protein